MLAISRAAEHHQLRALRTPKDTGREPRVVASGVYKERNG